MSPKDINNDKISPYKRFLADALLNGKDLNETFMTAADLVNKVYSERWELSTLTTRGKSTDLIRLYNLELGYKNTQMLLDVFKYWARIMTAGTTESRMSVICRIIHKHGIQIISDATFLKSDVV